MRRERGQHLLLLLPGLVVLGLTTLLPALFVLATSLTPMDLARPETFWDFDDPGVSYGWLLRDARFHNSLVVQAKLSVATVVLQIILGLAAALALNTRLRMRNTLRMIYMVPMVIPPVVAAIAWKILFTPDVSFPMWLLAEFGLPQIPWLVMPDLALWAIVIADTWQWFPFVLLVLFAALQVLPEEPIEAAKIDGAGPIQVFWHVVLPLLAPTLFVVALFRLIDSVKAFPLIYIMTSGGPGTTTEVTNYYAYQQGFVFSYIGSASAMTVTLLVGVFLLSAVAMRVLSRSQVAYE